MNFLIRCFKKALDLVEKIMFYPEKVFPTYLENWPDGLRKLSVPQVDIPLSLEDAHALGSHIWHFKQWFGDRRPIDNIINQLNRVLLNFPEGAFVRLGSRSGKDSYYAQEYGLKITQADAAIKMLTQASKRIAFDLHLALKYRYTPHIFVRQWVDIPKWAEFRCFMKRRRLVGISQYDCGNYYPEIAIHAVPIRFVIQSFFKRFKTVSHLDDVIFDVFITMPAGDMAHSWEVNLLEINPFCFKADPGLFHWHHDGDFDGSFRFLASELA
ncbi:MAG: hypothetical protein SVR94_18265 [Pseudomonadota bacterium]|nr:hypothetical protein [Pseudomonadota bacterium]